MLALASRKRAMALLVLLAGTAGAGIIAANFRASPDDRCLGRERLANGIFIEQCAARFMYFLLQPRGLSVSLFF